MKSKDLTNYLGDEISLLVANRNLSDGEYLNFATDVVLDVVEKITEYIKGGIEGVNEK